MGKKMEITKDSQLPTWKVISVAESDPSDFKTDQLPINPLTGEAYFDASPEGWRSEWKASEPQTVTEKECLVMSINEDIKANAPDGATHYENDSDSVIYYKCEFAKRHEYWDGAQWVHTKTNLKEKSIKPL